MVPPVGLEPTVFTAWVTDFKSVASRHFATGAIKKAKNPLT